MEESQDIEAARRSRLEQLCQDIAIATKQVANGQVTDGEIVFASLQAKIERIAQGSLDE